jgi:hypothetical protein
MTKKEMIQRIQLQEATLFLQAMQLELDYGRDALMTRSVINKWLGVNNMMEDLGIPSDLTLPEAREAAELIHQIRRYQIHHQKG